MLLYADALNPRTRTILVTRHGLDGEPHASCRRSASSSGSPASACARSRPRRSRACATPPCALARRRRHPRRLLARPTRHAPTCDTVGAAPRRQGMRGPRDAANGTDGPEGARTTPRPPPASGRSASTPSCARLSPAPSPVSSLRWPMPPRQPFPFWPRSSPRPSSAPMWPAPSCSSPPSCASCGLVWTATASPSGRATAPPGVVRRAHPGASDRGTILVPRWLQRAADHGTNGP